MHDPSSGSDRSIVAKTIVTANSPTITDIMLTTILACLINLLGETKVTMQIVNTIR